MHIGVCAYGCVCIWVCVHMGVCAYGCVCIWVCMHRVYVQWWLGVCISI